MAKKAPKKPVAPKPVKKKPLRRRRRRGSSGASAPGIFFIMALMILAVFSQQVAGLVAFGLLPTIVFGFTAKGSHKSQRMMCVGLTNAAGVGILIGDVWASPSAFESILVSLNTWIIMWGSAAIGYALNFVGPLIAAMIMQGVAQDRIKNINQQKQELLELWGPEVITSDNDPAAPGPPLRGRAR